MSINKHEAESLQSFAQLPAHWRWTTIWMQWFSCLDFPCRKKREEQNAQRKRVPGACSLLLVSFLEFWQLFLQCNTTKTHVCDLLKTLLLHHSELIATTRKEKKHCKEWQPLYHAQWKWKNHHNIPEEWCLPLFHGALPLLDCAILWRLNISFAGVVSTVLKRRSTTREAMLASSTCSLLEGWSSSSICCMSWKHNRVPGASTSEAMEVRAIKTNLCFEPCLEDCSFFTGHAALGHGCFGTMALEHTQ